MTGAPDGDDPYLALADDAVHRAAVRSRLEQQDRRDRASDLATWIGTLHDLAERGTAVSLTCAAGRTHRGALVTVGRDHVGMRLASGPIVLVALDTVRAVRPRPGQRAPVATGTRRPPADRTLAEVLQDLVDRDGRVDVALRGVADPIQGVVLGLGDDVVTVRPDGGGETVYLPLTAIAEVLVVGA